MSEGEIEPEEQAKTEEAQPQQEENAEEQQNEGGEDAKEQSKESEEPEAHESKTKVLEAKASNEEILGKALSMADMRSKMLMEQAMVRPIDAEQEEANLISALSAVDIKHVEIEETEDTSAPATKDDFAYSNVNVVLSGFELAMDDEEEMVEEEIEESEPSLPTPLDRLPYYEKYLLALKDYGVVKRMNNFYHKKMSEYFKKRKMEHVMREGDHPEEVYMKYAKKLDVFYELIERDKEQRTIITREMSELKAIRDERCDRAFDDFKSMMLREKEIGSGLIYTKTGKEIPDKSLDKMINIQRDKASELQDLRLTHIKIRNAVTEKHAAIRAMDRIGDNYTLMEFEQLKMENQGHADKIEERDEELSQLRKKCNGAIQCLAHVREKCAAVEIQTKIFKQDFDDKEYYRIKAREKVNALKLQRDQFRNDTQRMKEESGLLTKDKLLMDMEKSMEEIDQLETFMSTETKRFEKLKGMTVNVKKTYERETRKAKYRMNFLDREKSLKAVKSANSKRKKKDQLNVDQRLCRAMSTNFFIKIDDI